MQRKIQIPEEIGVLISGFLKGDISGDELKKLSTWISESEENKIQFNQIKSSWLLSGKGLSVADNKRENSLENIKKILKIRELNSFWSFGKIAASWFLVFILGGALSASLIFHLSEKKEQLVNTTISAPFGSKTLIDLPDGTSVWLNAGSKISYNSTFGKAAREITLTGEAYFYVKTDKKKPFLVKTSEVTVKAVGTRFNVKAYPDEKTVTTTLEEGKIILTSPNNQVELKPKQVLIYYKSTPRTVAQDNNVTEHEEKTTSSETTQIKVSPEVKTELNTSWKDETWIIEGQPLGTLAPILERRFNMVIKFDSDDIRKFKFTGKIKKETIEQIMNALELTAPIEYQITSNTITLSLNSKRMKRYHQNTNN